MEVKVFEVEVTQNVKVDPVLKAPTHLICPSNAQVIKFWTKSVQGTPTTIGYITYDRWKTTYNQQVMPFHLSKTLPADLIPIMVTSALPVPVSLFFMPLWYPLEGDLTASDDQFLSVIDAVCAFHNGVSSSLRGGAAHTLAVFFGKTIFQFIPKCAFEEARLAMEKKRWFELCDQHVTCERQWVQLMGFNGLDVPTVAANPIDEQSYYARYKRRDVPLDCPTVYFSVSVVDVEDASHLHIYPGGKVHIAWRDMPAWVWDTYWTWCVNLFFEPPSLVEELFPFTEAEARWLVTFLKMDEPQQQQKIAPPPLVKVRGINFDYTQEELIASMPPCIRAIDQHPSFPKHQERLGLVRYFIAIGASNECILHYFEKKNNAYPGKQKTLKRRFDVEDWAGRIRSSPNAQSCKSIIEHTRAKKDGIKCVMQDIEDMGAMKKQCAQRDDFVGPHVLARRILLAK